MDMKSDRSSLSFSLCAGLLGLKLSTGKKEDNRQAVVTAMRAPCRALRCMESKLPERAVADREAQVSRGISAVSISAAVCNADRGGEGREWNREV